MSSKKDQAGYVPPKPPAKPENSGQKGYVPPKLPVRPPQKPSGGKK
jgi:hypothetical protein